jgi:trimethylamine--corrinoid protein Co-methyltransferase
MMVKGLLRVINEAEMGRVHEAVMDILEHTGMILRGRFLLEALADAGCRVDFQRERAWFLPELVEKQIEAQKNRYRMVRSSLWYPFCREIPAGDAAWPEAFTVDYGFGTPVLYDYPEGKYRTPTQTDQVTMIKLGDALEPVRAVCAPFICGDVDSRIEVIESSRLMLLHTDKPGWVGTSDRREVKYLAEFAHLALERYTEDERRKIFREAPPFFVHAYCTTSPLKLDTHPCMVLEEALKHGFPVNFAPMPILGGTTPVTPAGSLVIAAAELLGCITAATLIDPGVFYFGTVISGEMDMRTTQVCYATPAAMLTDAALHQLFRFKYGLVVNVEPAYLEAKCPGMQAAFMKTYRQMALASMASSSLPIGLLDNGSVFSPVQAMIDLEVNQALYDLHKGLEITEETLGVDLINDMGFCETKAYIETEHTLRHFRDVTWDSTLFDRTYRKEHALRPQEADERILQEADRRWRSLVASHRSPERDSRFMAELDHIVAAAKKELFP